MIQVWHLDENKFFTGVSEFANEGDFNEVTMTTVPLLVGYVKPKFNGTEWVEGATVEEIQAYDDEKLLESLIPTQEEVNDAKLEIKTIQLLQDLGVLV